MATHRYLLADPVTDTPLGYIAPTGVSYSRRIMAQGEFNGQLPVTSRKVGELVRSLASRPAALYIERLVGSRRSTWWGGLVWTAAPTRGRRGVTTAALTGATFDSYAYARNIWSTIPAGDYDRGLLIASLWDHMQGQDGNSSIGVDPGAVALGGAPWTAGWDASASTPYAEAMAAVAAADPAFEWTVDVYTDPDGIRHRKLRIGAPTLGNPENRHLVCSPATMVGFSWSGENMKNATHGLARGAAVDKTVGGDILPITSGIAVNQTAVDAGALRVDALVDYPDETDPGKLPAHAAALVLRGAPKPTVTVKLPDASTLSPGSLGDLGRVWINDPTFNNGLLDTYARIIGIQVTPAERGRDEEITFEFQNDETAA